MLDPRIKPLLGAVAAVDRAALGFTSIPPDAQVSWERQPRAAYDQMLHIYGRTSRTIAFRRSGSGFRWTGEQEIYTGPHEYDSPDGKYHEQIAITFETESIATHGHPVNQLRISYTSEDKRLRARGLTLTDINPVLKEWGYK